MPICAGCIRARAAATVRAMAVVGLDHVQIAAPPGCEGDARRFYGGVLDLPELPKPEALAARGGLPPVNADDTQDLIRLWLHSPGP